MTEKKSEATKKGGAAKGSDEPIKVAVVPNDPVVDPATQTDEAVKNRNASYLPSPPAINQEEADDED